MIVPGSPAEVEEVLGRAAARAAARPDVQGLALVGSYARGAATPESDVDLALLTTSPQRYLESDDWATDPGAIRVEAPVDWGVVTERRIVRASGLEVEVGVTPPCGQE